MRQRSYLIYLFIAFLWGCSPQQKDQVPKSFRNLKNLTVFSLSTKPDKTISLKKEVIYDNSQKVLIGKLGDMAVGSLGRVFIADVQKQIIDVFESDGRFLVQLGGKGDGPSEFSYIKRLKIRNNHLYAFDANFGTRKVNTFTLDTLAGGKTILLIKNRSKYRSLAKAYPGIYKAYVRNNGTYLAEFISRNPRQKVKKWQNVEMNGLFYLLDDNGMITSKLFEFKSETRTQLKAFLYHVKPFFGNALTVLSKDNRIYWAGPNYFLIKVYSPDGAYQRAFYYPHKKISITRESAIEAEVSDSFIRDMNSMNLPVNWPVLRQMKFDDQDRLWVATTVKDMKVFEWWVLKPDGQLIARFNWPRSKPIQVIKNGYIYTKEKNNDGLEEIVRYRIEMK